MSEDHLSDCDDEEEILYVDFDSGLLPADLDSPALDLKIIGIDTEEPIAEVNGKLFRGTYEFSLGTHVFLEKNEDGPPLDPLFDVNPGEMYKYMTKCTKILKMNRLFVENKNSCSGVMEEENFDELKSRMDAQMSYEEALNLLLPSGTHRKMSVTEQSVEDGGPSSGNDGNDSDYVMETQS